MATSSRASNPRRALVALASSLALATVAGCAHQPPGPAASQTPASTPPRITVIETAEEMIGTPYRYGGSRPDGFDCSGLVKYSYARAGIQIPRTTHRQFRHSQPLGTRRLQPGDLVFFSLAHKVSHVGIYVGDGRFIHAPSSGRTVTVSRLDNPYWRRHFIRGGRVPAAY